MERKRRLHGLTIFINVSLLSVTMASQTGKQFCFAAPESVQFTTGRTCLNQTLTNVFISKVVVPTYLVDIAEAGDKKFFQPIEQNQNSNEVANSTFLGEPERAGGSFENIDPPDDGSPSTFLMEKNTNQHWHTMDREFIVLQTFSWTAVFADLWTTQHGLAVNPTAHELNPLFGKHPSRARLYGIGIPLSAIPSYLSYKEKKLAPRRGIWKINPRLSIIVHSLAAVDNLMVAHQ